MAEPVIRPATAADRSAILAIRYTEPEPEILTICGSADRARRVGALLVGYGVEIRTERTTVLEVEGRAVALMEVWLEGDGPRLGAWNVVRILGRGLLIGGPGLIRRYRRHANLRERVDTPRPSQSLYIAHLNTHPENRGQGYGGKLLAHAEAMAKLAKLPQLALDVYTTNPARHLYERHGFRTTSEKTDPEFERAAGVPGYAAMVKKLR